MATPSRSLILHHVSTFLLDFRLERSSSRHHHLARWSTIQLTHIASPLAPAAGYARNVLFSNCSHMVVICGSFRRDRVLWGAAVAYVGPVVVATFGRGASLKGMWVVSMAKKVSAQNAARWSRTRAQCSRKRQRRFDQKARCCSRRVACVKWNELNDEHQFSMLQSFDPSTH